MKRPSAIFTSFSASPPPSGVTVLLWPHSYQKLYKVSILHWSVKPKTVPQMGESINACGWKPPWCRCPNICEEPRVLHSCVCLCVCECVKCLFMWGFVVFSKHKHHQQHQQTLLSLASLTLSPNYKTWALLCYNHSCLSSSIPMKIWIIYYYGNLIWEKHWACLLFASLLWYIVIYCNFPPEIVSTLHTQ